MTWFERGEGVENIGLPNKNGSTGIVESRFFTGKRKEAVHAAPVPNRKTRLCSRALIMNEHYSDLRELVTFAFTLSVIITIAVVLHRRGRGCARGC